MSPELLRLYRNEPIVYETLRAGGTVEDALVRMTKEKERMRAMVNEFARIVPRKVKGPDGKVYVWHCPDHLVPESASESA